MIKQQHESICVKLWIKQCVQNVSKFDFRQTNNISHLTILQLMPGYNSNFNSVSLSDGECGECVAISLVENGILGMEIFRAMYEYFY